MLYLLHEINKFAKESKPKNSNKNQANISNILQLAIQTTDFSNLLTSKNFYVKILNEDLSFKKRLFLKNLFQIIKNASSLLPYLIQIILFVIFMF